jgi:hypothetical protein
MKIIFKDPAPKQLFFTDVPHGGYFEDTNGYLCLKTDSCNYVILANEKGVPFGPCPMTYNNKGFPFIRVLRILPSVEKYEF